MTTKPPCGTTGKDHLFDKRGVCVDCGDRFATEATFEVTHPKNGGPNIICNGGITFTVPQFIADALEAKDAEIERLREQNTGLEQIKSRVERLAQGNDGFAKQQLAHWILNGWDRELL